MEQPLWSSPLLQALHAMDGRLQKGLLQQLLAGTASNLTHTPYNLTLHIILHTPSLGTRLRPAGPGEPDESNEQLERWHKRERHVRALRKKRGLDRSQEHPHNLTCTS
jgi:hypothetical protein